MTSDLVMCHSVKLIQKTVRGEWVKKDEKHLHVCYIQ